MLNFFCTIVDLACSDEETSIVMHCIQVDDAAHKVVPGGGVLSKLVLLT